MTVAAPSGTGAIKWPAAELKSEIAWLRRELASLKLDKEILRKTAAYFARDPR